MKFVCRNEHESFLLPTSVEDYFSLTNDPTGEMVNDKKNENLNKSWLIR